MASEFTNRLIQLKEINNDSIKSGNISSFPLFYLLFLYTRSRNEEVYCSYMDGFNHLRDWLTPICIPEIPYFYINPALITYEMNQFASMFNCPIHVIYYLLVELTHGPKTATTLLQ